MPAHPGTLPHLLEQFILLCYREDVEHPLHRGRSWPPSCAGGDLDHHARGGQSKRAELKYSACR